MMEIFWFILLSLAGGLTALGVFIYFTKQGQFEDPEDPKYQMFRDEDS